MCVMIYTLYSYAVFCHYNVIMCVDARSSDSAGVTRKREAGT